MSKEPPPPTVGSGRATGRLLRITGIALIVVGPFWFLLIGLGVAFSGEDSTSVALLVWFIVGGSPFVLGVLLLRAGRRRRRLASSTGASYRAPGEQRAAVVQPAGVRQMRVRLLLVLAGVIGAVLIAFIVFTGGSTDAGGSGDRDPSWSPDRERLAYVRFQIGDSCESSIWVKDADGGNDRKLVDGGEHPDWSPDGRFIAFTWVEYDGLGVSRGGIAVIDADGSHLQRILSSRNMQHGALACFTGRLNDPKWSPDGELIALSDPSAPGIFLMHPDGTHRKRLTSGNDVFPDWSPDGKRLVFVHVTSRPSYERTLDITVAKIDGTGRRVLTTSDTDDPELQGSRPAWSPGGVQIAYVHSTGIALIPATGGHSTPLVDCPLEGACWSPSWRPDGKQIAYSKGHIAGDQRIHFVDVGARSFPCLGGSTRPLTTKDVVTVFRRNGFSVRASAKLDDCTDAAADPITAYVITNKGHEKLEGNLSCALSQASMWLRRLHPGRDVAAFFLENIECHLYPKGSHTEDQVMRFGRAFRQFAHLG